MKGDILNVFYEFGREIGIAYQLADDLVDLEKGEILDSVILPLLNKIEKQKIVKYFKDKKIKKELKEKHSEIKKLYIDEIRTHVKKAKELAKSNLIPESTYKNFLFDAPDFIINQMLKEINMKV